MNISDNFASSQYGRYQSILRSANKQPELALELIMKTVQSLQPAGEMQSTSETVPPPSAPSSTVGKFIDIMV